MGFRTAVKDILEKILNSFGYAIVPQVNVYDWQQKGKAFDRTQAYLPQGAEDYLTPDNPRLIEFQQSYKECDYPSSEILLWTDDRVKKEDILYFRAHNAYLFQEGSFNRNLFGYLLAYYYTKSIDKMGLLDILDEDRAFGAITYQIDGREISRDLLDSILEIYFLEKHMGLFQKENLTVLDIGAGYGRLAHRMVKALPNLKYYGCTDAIPVSSFIADYYLQYRGVDNKAQVLPLDIICNEKEVGAIDLAINVHSFSECTLTAIKWWLAMLQERDVQYLLIVPNSGEELLTNDGKDFYPLLSSFGYELVAVEPKYLDPVVQKYGMNPDHYHLYQRTGF